MEFPYVIMTDLSCDMVLAKAKTADIHMIPMSYSLGEKERVCSHFEDDETLSQFYQGLRNGEVTRTTQIPPQVYKDVFTDLAKAGNSVLYISLSSGLSSTYASSYMAAGWVMENYPDQKILCVDSRSATIGLGLLMEAAIANRDAGMSIEENAAWLEANRNSVEHWFMVEDLMYLKRGGRLSATTAIVGTALNIKPILMIKKDGSLDTFAKKRGEKTAMSYLIDCYKNNRRENDEAERVLIGHADAPERAEQLVQMVKNVNPKAEITVHQLTPIIGAHVGPGMCAVVHWGKNQNRQ